MKKGISVGRYFLLIAILAVTTHGCDNTPPVANTGSDQEVIANTTVTLDGSSSMDADGNRLSYNWSLVAVPEGSIATLSDPKVAMPTFIPDIDGIYQVSLTVNDGSTDSASDNMTIVVFNQLANNQAKNGFPLLGSAGTLMVSQTDDEPDLDLLYCE